MPAYSYTPGEIAWLLSLNGSPDEDDDEPTGEDQARALDVQSLRSTGNWGAGDESGLPVIARWHDVRRAQTQVVDRKADRLLAARLNGASEQQVADDTGLSQQTVNRKVRARLADIVAELDDPRVDHEPRLEYDRLPRPLCAACYMGAHNVRLSRAPKVRTPAVRLAATVAERWVCAGRIWDASRGRAVQRWHTRHGDVLEGRALKRRRIGAAYDAVFRVDHDPDSERVLLTRLAFTRVPDQDLPAKNPHVGQWKRATEHADAGEYPPLVEKLPAGTPPDIMRLRRYERQRHVATAVPFMGPPRWGLVAHLLDWEESALPRLPLPIADVEPERQTQLCEAHLPAELRPRIIRERRWPA